MTAEEKESPKSKPRISIPAGAMAILPLRNTVLFPSTVMPLVVGRPSSLQAIEEAVRQQVPIGLVAQRDPAMKLHSLRICSESVPPRDVSAHVRPA